MVLYNQNTGEIRQFPTGYRVHGKLQPMGEIEPGVFHLNYVPQPKPQHTAEQYATSEWQMKKNDYKQVWTVHDKSQEQIDYEQALQDWPQTEWAKRIVAPIGLIMDNTGIKMYGWFQINGFPVVKAGESVHLYCNVILPEHQDIVDAFGGQIKIEDRPEILCT